MVRCTLEMSEHLQGCFITLTYARSPVYLYKKHVQLFMKRLRKRIDPIKIKYFIAGEYGTKNFRPHFHINIFGYEPSDLVLYQKSNSGNDMYTSDFISSIWEYGLHTIQTLDSNTIKYSALYSAKDKTEYPDYLKGCPEFNLMSKGLGYNQFLKKEFNYIRTDQIFVKGIAYPIPEAFLRKRFYSSSTKTEAIRNNYSLSFTRLDTRRWIKNHRHFTDYRLQDVNYKYRALKYRLKVDKTKVL